MTTILARRTSGACRPICRFGFASAAALALTSVAPSAAFAQADEEALEEITVTGSRIRANPNLAAATPVLSVTGEEAAIRGNVRVEDFVNVLPQVFANQASEVSNGASGTAALNLRGLGRNRTLVMIDGRRLPYGSSQISAANLDIIPMQMVERVDILTGGASAVYGSDAVGGVANFILRSDFDGVEVGGQYSVSYNSNDDDFWASVLEAGSQPVPGSTTDGEEALLYIMLGANTQDGRGNATVYASYEDRRAIAQADRVFSGCALGQDDGPESFGGFGCVGSGNYRLFVGSGGAAFQQEDGTIIPFAGGPSQTFNFGPFNFFQRPSERYNIYAKGHYEIADSIEAFADFSYMNNLSDAQIAPTASFGTSSYSFNCDNPFLQTPGLNLATDIYGCTAADIAAGTIVTSSGASHRNVEGGPRNSRLENSTLRVATGLRGSFADDVWGWEVFVQNSETRDQAESTNDFVVANLQQAFLAVDDGTGNVVCTDPSGGCVPYNPFQRGPNGESLITPEQTAFIQGIGLVNGSTSQFLYGGTLQADLGEYGIKIPTADYGISFLVGFEQRTDKLDARPDEISQVPGGGFTGVGGATLPVRGEVDVTELFTEFEIPLVSDIVAIQELTLRGQYRYSDYEGSGNNTTSPFETDTYGMSLAWAPIDTLRFRAQYQRAVRAPNVIELYTGQNTNLPNLSSAGTNANGVQLFDPCASDAPIATLEQCQRTGVTAAQYGTILDVISGQTQSLTGGNPDLQAEEADTVTFGFVWTPEFIEGLSVSVDYFNILVEDVISAGIPAQTTLDQCLATGDETFCSLIQRAPRGDLASGTQGVGFQQTNINLAELETTGLDFQVVYDFDIGSHGFRIDYASTYLDQLDTTPFPGADVIECAGFFGNNCQGGPGQNSVSPEYRHRVVGTWMSPWSIDFGMTWRYFDEVKNDNAGDTVEPKLDAINYVDLTASWWIMDGTIQIRGSLLNVLGEDPPVFTSAGPSLGNGNTYPTTYDTGTVMTLGFKWNFGG
jgi:outer membrane receptor protein involved in Fe transport